MMEAHQVKFTQERHERERLRARLREICTLHERLRLQQIQIETQIFEERKQVSILTFFL